MYTGCWLASIMEGEEGEASIMMYYWRKDSTGRVGQAVATTVTSQTQLLLVISEKILCYYFTELESTE